MIFILNNKNDFLKFKVNEIRIIVNFGKNQVSYLIVLT